MYVCEKEKVFDSEIQITSVYAVHTSHMQNRSTRPKYVPSGQTSVSRLLDTTIQFSEAAVY